MKMIIDTFWGSFHRTAWTGGDSETTEFKLSGVGQQLFNFFFNEQIADCGGNVKNWLMGDQTEQEKLQIFTNRAWADAWATSKNPVKA
jgi:hypothetical protein